MASGAGGREHTKFPGVYQRVSAVRRHEGKPDVCFDISYKMGGRKIWEKVGWRSEGYTAGMASQIRAERLREGRHGDMPEIVLKGRQGLTLGDAWRNYNTMRLVKVKRPETERGRWRLHLAHLKDLSISSITPLKLEALKASLEGKGLSPQSARHVLGLLGRVVNHAIRMRLWSGTNPLREMAMPKVDNRRHRFLTPDEAERLLAEVKLRSLDTWRICIMSLHTGMRFGEIASLRWDAVNLDMGTAQAVDPKNGSSRSVPLNSTAVQMLRGIGCGKGLVFPAGRGKSKDEAARKESARKHGNTARLAVSTAFARAVKRLGLNNGVSDRRAKVVFHTLRHTYASWLAMSGVPLYQLMELMGHSSIEMTKRYANLCPAQGRDASAHVERLLMQAGHASSAGGPE